MWAFLAKLLPFLGPLAERLWPSSRADELRAEAELEEARAFSHGRIAPRYLLGYTLVLLLTLFGLAVLVDSVVPGLIPGAPLHALNELRLTSADWITATLGLGGE